MAIKNQVNRVYNQSLNKYSFKIKQYQIIWTISVTMTKNRTENKKGYKLRRESFLIIAHRLRLRVRALNS